MSKKSGHELPFSVESAVANVAFPKSLRCETLAFNSSITLWKPIFFFCLEL